MAPFYEEVCKDLNWPVDENSSCNDEGNINVETVKET